MNEWMDGGMEGCRDGGVVEENNGANAEEEKKVEDVCGVRWSWVWWFSGRFGALRPEDPWFESHSIRQVGTLGKSFTLSCLWRFGVFTPTVYQCCSRQRL